MGTASATTLPTTESTKAYVDSKDLNRTLTTLGDLFVRGSSAIERIGIGATDQVLTVQNATTLAWKDNPAKKVVDMPWATPNIIPTGSTYPAIATKHKATNSNY